MGGHSIESIGMRSCDCVAEEWLGENEQKYILMDRERVHESWRVMKPRWGLEAGDVHVRARTKEKMMFTP